MQFEKYTGVKTEHAGSLDRLDWYKGKKANRSRKNLHLTRHDPVHATAAAPGKCANKKLQFKRPQFDVYSARRRNLRRRWGE